MVTLTFADYVQLLSPLCVFYARARCGTWAAALVPGLVDAVMCYFNDQEL